MKIKILHIITRMEQGGAPRVVLNLIKHLNASRYQSVLVSGFTKNPQKDLLKKAEEIGAEVIVIPHFVRKPNPVRDLLTLFRLITIIRNSGCHIVHTHTSKAGFLGRLAAKYCGIKVIFHSTHGTIFHGYFNPVMINLYLLLEKLAANFTDKIICLSKKEIDEYLEKGIGKPENITSIYNGIDISEFEKAATNPDAKRVELSIKQSDYLGATIGRLEKVKGQQYLIEAVPFIIKDVPNFRLLIIGDGEESDNLKYLVRENNISSHVTFLGNREDILEILACIDCFYLPSLNEGFGIVLLEAMAMKKPIIATAVGGIPEVVLHGETGILVPPKDPQSISQATLTLFRNKEMRERMGLAGYARVRNYFGIENQVKATENLYEDILKQKGTT